MENQILFYIFSILTSLFGLYLAKKIFSCEKQKPSFYYMKDENLIDSYYYVVFNNKIFYIGFCVEEKYAKEKTIDFLKQKFNYIINEKDINFKNQYKIEIWT